MTSAGDPMASFRMLGRLQTVGLGAGGLLGGVFAVVLVLTSSAGLDGLVVLPFAVAVGTVVGVVAGVVAQVLTHVLVLVAVWVGLPARVPAIVVPVVAAGGVAWRVPAELSDMTVVGTVVAVLTVVALAAVMTGATAGWAVRPLVESRYLVRGAGRPGVR
jgi:hypothetical protein